MKNIIVILSGLFLYSSLSAQQYIPLQDNWDIPSGSWYNIIGGTYNFPDPEKDGVIRIINKHNIIIDGDSVTVNGADDQGYMAIIENSHDIIIRNFEMVKDYYYAVKIKNSHNIIINGNVFSHNKKDTTGWISIWTGVNSALGGGVLMDQCRAVEVFDNTMQQQNDGVAMYDCDSIHIHDNILNWNTGFGIRMNFTDSCYIHHNVCSHVNRETDPSDCAAILLIVSNENTVVHNDFTYSGDGIFLGQYEYSSIPNNNYFAYNDCSYSPHNAIEATFADGNVYKHNLCNYSHYGFWLGYSFNSLVDSNEVIGNQHSGIAIDRGYNNTITHNIINENPTGIELWEGDGIPPYQNQYSHDYQILGNTIQGNTIAISAKKTEGLIVKHNDILENRNGIYIEGEAQHDTITGNLFKRSTFYHIENRSTQEIYAVANDFGLNDEDVIACNIYDIHDNSSVGEVIWHPFTPGPDPAWQHIPVSDLAEPPAVWFSYPEACWSYGLWEPTITSWDTVNKKEGNASIHLSTGNGWDLGMLYRPGGDSIASWALHETDTLFLWIRSVNNTGYGFQYCNFILGNDCGGYYKYTASAGTILNPTMNQWKHYAIPLTGASPWSRTIFGNVSFSDISFLEFHADTWEYGFELWLDGIHFSSPGVGIGDNAIKDPGITVFPNPAHDRINLLLNENLEGKSEIAVYNSFGKTVYNRQITKTAGSPMIHEIDVSNWPAGMYVIRAMGKNASWNIKVLVK
ncbi:MAG: right-handed parallel beta-helix repeat-containing protein [Bacteroidetes bacterium]|nr:right-handed parallel beta-helix repeat-containing protein [Bacteroidota bacterium]